MPVTKVNARVRFLYGAPEWSIISVPADVVEQDRAHHATAEPGEGPIWAFSGGRVDGPYRTARAAGHNAFVILGVEP